MSRLRRLLPCVAVIQLAFAQAAPPKVTWLPAAQIAEGHRKVPSLWQSLLDMPTLTMSRYRLTKGQQDSNPPRSRDAVYYVVAGKAKLQAGEEVRAIGAGDSVFVGALVAYQFLDIEQDLDVIAFTSRLRGPTGGMAAAPAPTEQTPYPETSQRGNARVFYWFGPDSAGQVAIDYGQPLWRAAYFKYRDEPTGRRWRLGENFWTTLDTNMPLQLGGVEVPIGQYYLVLQSTKDTGPQLVLLDPQEVRKQRLDAYEANKTTGGLVVPLTLSLNRDPDSQADRLEIELLVDRKQRDRGELVIRFGANMLRAPLVMRPYRP